MVYLPCVGGTSRGGGAIIPGGSIIPPVHTTDKPLITPWRPLLNTRIHFNEGIQITQIKHNKLNPGLVTSYDLRPGNGVGLFIGDDWMCWVDDSPIIHTLTNWEIFLSSPSWITWAHNVACLHVYSVDLYLQNIVFHFWPKLTHPAQRSLCDSWATCYPVKSWLSVCVCLCVNHGDANERKNTCNGNSEKQTKNSP